MHGFRATQDQVSDVPTRVRDIAVTGERSSSVVDVTFGVLVAVCEPYADPWFRVVELDLRIRVL